MRGSSLAALLLGLLASAGLVLWAGADAVAGALLAAGLEGVLAITLFNAVPITLCALAWRALLEPGPRHSVLLLIWARFLRGSVSELVPIGGELVAIRVMALRGIRSGLAGASTIVDLTLELAGQIGFTALGLLLLALDGRADEIVLWSILGLGLAAIGAGGFFLVQRRGFFRWIELLPHRIAAHFPWAKLPELAGLDRDIQDIYRRPRALVSSLLWHSLAWIVGIGEAWLALWFLDAPLPVAAVLIIESLAFALRSIAFAVPAALGVQEIGYVALGTLFGLGPDLALALSLMKRAREVLLAVPALMSWKAVEVNAWRRRADFA